MTAFDAVCPYDFTGIQQEGIRRKINEDCAESRMLATWVRAASSAHALRRRLLFQQATCRDCALEATRTQA